MGVEVRIELGGFWMEGTAGGGGGGGLDYTSICSSFWKRRRRRRRRRRRERRRRKRRERIRRREKRSSRSRRRHMCVSEGENQMCHLLLTHSLTLLVYLHGVCVTISTEIIFTSQLHSV